MMQLESNYLKLIETILMLGVTKQTRNAKTRSIFGPNFTFDMSYNDSFPLLNIRRIYYKGILGELAAMLRGPKSKEDFEKFGCNYWADWADEDGALRVDYGNLWVDWNGYNQLAELITKLKNTPNDRRLMINSWKPDTMDQLSLPCCHFNYQWYVRKTKNGRYLDLLWSQRSCDVMIGLPSDIVLAAALNILVAAAVPGLLPGRITMSLGDTHIYEQHIESAAKMYSQKSKNLALDTKLPTYHLSSTIGSPIQDFVPKDIEIFDYNPVQKVSLEIIA